MQQRQREFEYTWDDFDFLRKISNEYSGILVSDDKFDMFYSRIVKRIRLLKLANFQQYCQYLKNNYELEFTEFINAITTNLTSFFREKHHFDYLQNVVIPDILKKNCTSRRIMAWSAGCSTGEEPYSIAMTLLETVPSHWEIKILATDLDTNVLATASKGIYSNDRVSGLTEQQLAQFFKRGKDAQQNKVKVKDDVTQLVKFKQLNLMADWPIKTNFDFIFCRNVLIYFDMETKANLAGKFATLLAGGSRLFIGHSESLHQLETDFNLIGNTIYQKS